MTPQRFSQIRSIFEDVLAHPAESRESRLAELTGSNHTLREDVLRLLAAHGASGALIDIPLAGTPSDRDEATKTEGAVEPSPDGADLGHLPIGYLVAGRYRVERELTRGGFGLVYVSRDLQLHDRAVVVKVLQRRAMDSWTIRKFHDEAAALARIDHPGVVGALDSGTLSDGRPFLVMQFVEGITLRVALREGALPIQRASSIILQIGQALAAAHATGVVHRDLKPENIMLQSVSEGDRVRLIDFGIARLYEAGETSGHTRIAGTPPYMAPEQLGGLPGPASDVWAFGAVTYEILTGHPPFARGGLAQFDAAGRDAPIPPSTCRQNLSPRVDGLILAALEIQPERRPANAAQFARELAAAVLESPDPGRWWGTRTRLTFAFAMIVVLAGATAIWHQISAKSVPPHQTAITNGTVLSAPEFGFIVRHRTGAIQVAASGAPFSAEDQFRIHARTREGGYYYVLSETHNSQRERTALSLLYPAPAVSGFAAAGNELLIPGQSWFVFEGPSVQQVWLVWSRGMVPELEQLRVWLNKRDGGAIGNDALRERIIDLLRQWQARKGKAGVIAVEATVEAR